MDKEIKSKLNLEGPNIIVVDKACDMLGVEKIGMEKDKAKRCFDKLDTSFITQASAV